MHYENICTLYLNIYVFKIDSCNWRLTVAQLSVWASGGPGHKLVVQLLASLNSIKISLLKVCAQLV
jgi:hypothetical protein